MTRGDTPEPKPRKLVLICAVIALICTVSIIAWGLSCSAEYQRQADNHAREYAADTYQKVGNTCIGMTKINKANCINEARHERRANERDEQDLVAQRQSALWAYIMGSAAVIGMGLSALGVFLVWTTFRETRKTNEIAIAQTEPNIIHESTRITCHATAKPPFSPIITSVWNNTGGTTAYDVCIEYNVFVTCENGNLIDRGDITIFINGGDQIEAGVTRGSQAHMQSMSFIDIIKDVTDRKILVHVNAAITYRAMFEKTRTFDYKFKSNGGFYTPEPDFEHQLSIDMIRVPVA